MTLKNTETYRLANGVEIPKIGFGTWQIPSGEAAYDSTMAALKAGYRHIDTAAAYGNESSIGQAIRDFGIARDEIFITSKLPAEKKGYAIAKDEFEKTIKRLGVDVLDLYLIHAPKPWGSSRDAMEFMQDNIESWKAMVELYHAKKIRSIGVSNFGPEHIQPLIDATQFTPHVDQIYLCPGAPQENTVSYAKNHGILIEAYSPFSTGRLFQSPVIHDLATKYGVTPGTLALRWSLQKGHLPLPKSVTPERIIQNLHVKDFVIADEDVLKLDRLGHES